MPETSGWWWVEFAGPAPVLERLLAELDGTGMTGSAEGEATQGEAVLRVYWPAALGPETVQLAAAAAAAATGARRVDRGLQQPEDWLAEWKRHFRPVHAAPHIWVCPPWDVRVPRPGQHVVVIEPQMAFGTGTHPTTRMCLALLEERVRPGDTVLDVGCGSGVLAIAAAMLGAARVDAVDVDPDAIANAERNVARNGVGSLVRLACVDATDAALPKATHVVCNMITMRLERLLPRLAMAQAGGGLILSGVALEHRDEFVRRFGAAGLRLAAERRQGEWCAFACAGAAA